MSFASDIKKELTNLPVTDCCIKSELSALIQMNGSISFSNHRLIVDIQTENAAIARRIYLLLKKQYFASVEILVRKKMRLKKNNIYLVRLVDEVQEILQDLEILGNHFQINQQISPSLIQKPCCKKAYLRGAFLAGRIGKQSGNVLLPFGNFFIVQRTLRFFKCVNERILFK